MIKVWTDGAEAGLLDRSGERGSTFFICPIPARARGLCNHAVRLPSWDRSFGLPPIFEMNLPKARCARGSALPSPKPPARLTSLTSLLSWGVRRSAASATPARRSNWKRMFRSSRSMNSGAQA